MSEIKKNNIGNILLTIPKINLEKIPGIINGINYDDVTDFFNNEFKKIDYQKLEESLKIDGNEFLSYWEEIKKNNKNFKDIYQRIKELVDYDYGIEFPEEYNQTKEKIQTKFSTIPITGNNLNSENKKNNDFSLFENQSIPNKIIIKSLPINYHNNEIESSKKNKINIAPGRLSSTTAWQAKRHKAPQRCPIS